MIPEYYQKVGSFVRTTIKFERMSLVQNVATLVTYLLRDRIQYS